LGAEASAKLYLDIVRETMQKNNERYPAILVWNTPISLEEDELLMKDPKTTHQNVVNLLDDGIDRLIKAGANIIGIACNTIHYLLPMLPAYKVNLLNIVDCTVTKVENLSIKSVGLLATTANIESEIYTHCLREKGIEPVLPCDAD